jgi:HEAT repeat protein
MFNFDFNFDRISFWLGFIAASLVWWPFSRVRPLLPEWRDQIRQTIDTINQRNLAGVEYYLRQETLQRAQRQHLTAPLFSLDDILIEPGLMIPPSKDDPTAPEPAQSIAGQVIPYLPDWPELVAPFGVPSLTPAQALQSGRSLVIIGQPGSGKTVALAHLASQIARQDPATGKYVNAIPVFVHALELDTTLAENEDPMINMIRAISGNASMVMQPQIPRFLKAVFKDKQRKVVLLLDGLDELSAQQMTAMQAYLAAFLKRHPRLQIIATASSDYIDGLTRINLFPLALAAWSLTQKKELTQKWGKAWSEQISPEIRKQNKGVDLDPLLMENWLSGENAYATPLEWSLRLWGAYAGDMGGSHSLGALHTYLARFLPNPAMMPALEALAHQMVQASRASLSFDEAEKILSSVAIQKATQLQPVEPSAASDPAVPVDASISENSEAVSAEAARTGEQSTSPGKGKRTRSKGRRDVMGTQGELILSALISSRVLVQLGNRQIRFANPVLLGFLAGMQTTYGEAERIVETILEKIDWPVYLIVLRYAAACSENPIWIYPLIDHAEAPLYRTLLLAARWMKDSPPEAEWRAHTMRNLVTKLQDDLIPLGMRARIIAAFLLSQDASILKLFKQLLNHKSPVVRRAALLGSGALGSPQLINDILGQLADFDPAMRNTACLALSAIPGEAALNAIVQVLLSGDEEIRQAAAEALSRIKPDGHKVLEEAAAEEDLLTRRASVYGLVQIREPWAREVLEKMAVGDGQWVVRNAAAQALETMQDATAGLPKPLPKPSESPWLLTFASKLGMGILPGQPATDVLNMVLKSGSVEEQIAALSYLKERPDGDTIGAIYGLYYSGQEALYEPVLHTLWWISICDSKLPAAAQFGLG